jgi:guanylate kinase
MNIDIYEGDIGNLTKKLKQEEVLALLIENVDRDVRSYFYISLENFQRFEEINEVQDWVNAYWENLYWHLSDSIKKFLKNNGYAIYALMKNSHEVFKKLIEEAKEMFPHEEEE